MPVSGKTILTLYLYKSPPLSLQLQTVDNRGLFSTVRTLETTFFRRKRHGDFNPKQPRGCCLATPGGTPQETETEEESENAHV